jgi:hypothetical protein
MAVKYMAVEEFQKLGFLQEINRRLLHSAGLALEVMVSADGAEQRSGVWDFRDDSEGIVFGDLSKSENRKKVVTVEGCMEAHWVGASRFWCQSHDHRQSWLLGHA